MQRAVAAAAVLVICAVGIGIATSRGSEPAGGLRITYETGASRAPHQIWLAGADGHGARMLGAGTRPRLSPDGRLVAASSVPGQGQALTLYGADGTVTGRYFNALAQTAVAQAWSPDSRYLAVVLSSTDPASDASSGLAVIDTKAGSYRVLAYGTIYGASFAPDHSERIVYARAATGALSARVNLHVVAVDGTGDHPLTSDGRSLYPLWGRLGIAFDRERLRTHADPAYQLYLMNAAGTAAVQITDVPVPPLFDGLVPLALSEDGTKLLAEYVGAETSQAWAVDVMRHQARKLRRAGHSVAGAAISKSGDRLLIDRGGFLNPPDRGTVETLAFVGPEATTLVAHGSNPSWNL